MASKCAGTLILVACATASVDQTTTSATRDQRVCRAMQVLLSMERVWVWPSRRERIMGRCCVALQRGRLYLSWLPYAAPPPAADATAAAAQADDSAVRCVLPVHAVSKCRMRCVLQVRSMSKRRALRSAKAAFTSAWPSVFACSQPACLSPTYRTRAQADLARGVQDGSVAAGDAAQSAAEVASAAARARYAMPSIAVADIDAITAHTPAVGCHYLMLSACGAAHLPLYFHHGCAKQVTHSFLVSPFFLRIIYVRRTRHCGKFE